MMKYFRFTGVAVLLLMLLLSGCSDSGSNTTLQRNNAAADIAEAEKTAALESYSDNPASYMVINDGKLYWKNDNIIWSGGIENDGRLSNISLITTAEEDIKKFAISGQNLYYTTKYGLYEMKLHVLPADTTQLLDEDYITDFHIMDDRIYFVDDNCLFLTNLGGGNSRELFPSIVDFCILNNTIYYVANGNMLLSSDLNGENRDVLADVSNIHGLTIHDEMIYLMGDDLYTYDISGKEMAQVPLAHQLEEDSDVFICDDYILYESANDYKGQYFFADGRESSLEYAFFAGEPYMVHSDDFIYYTFGFGTLTITDMNSLEHTMINKEDYCGTAADSSGSADSDSSSSNTSASSVSPDDYDIAANLEVRITDGYGLAESDYFSLVIPYSHMKDNLWEIIPIDKNSIGFYYAKAKASGNGGMVFSLMAFDQNDDSYTDFPSYNIAGEGCGKKYIILFATDVQYDVSDSVQASEYDSLLDYASHINVNDSSSPFAATP